MKPALPFVLCAFLLGPGVSAAQPGSPAAPGRIHLDDGGRGDAAPVLFVHGNGGSAEQWRAQLEHLRRSRRAVAIDLPGFGKSAAPADGDYSLGAMVAAMDRALADAGLKRFVLVGHSYGGAVVAKYAAAHPEKVAGVVYLDAAAARLPLTDAQKEKFGVALRADKMKVVRSWFAPMLAASKDAVRAEVLGSVERTPTEAFLAAFLSLADYDAQALVEAYPGPRMAIAASGIESPMSFQKQFPEIETVSIAGAGHWLMLDAPEAVNAAIDRFLARVG